MSHSVEKIGGTSMSDYAAVRDNIILAAQLFEISVSTTGCSKDFSSDEWLMRACDISGRHS